MGHRDCRRVPLDFDWPLKKLWKGYIQPEELDEEPCLVCDGTGYSFYARALKDRWYGYTYFSPSETGSTLLTPHTPAVRSFAERNVERAPEYYGRGETAIVSEAERLCAMWNTHWCHHLCQEDVDALVEAGRLRDLTHTFDPKAEGADRWVPTGHHPTAEEVNAWSIGGFGHDAINCSIVVQAACESAGQPVECGRCEGHGSTEKYEGQRAEAEAWEWEEPPVGEGWQLWETTSEGSPVSPVFASAEELADWCADNATYFADLRMSRDEWLEGFIDNTTDVDTLLVMSVPPYEP